MTWKIVNTLALLACVLESLLIECQEKKMTPYLKYVNEIVLSVAQEMTKEYGLEYMGSGGKMPYDVEEIDIMFSMFHNASITKARQIGITAAQKLIKKINEHQSIQPYLHYHPFTSDNIWITISFYDKNGEYYKNDLATFACLNGKVIYTKAEIHKIHSQGVICGETGKYLIPPEDKEKEELVTILRETYEEAEAIVERETQAKP